MTFCLLLLIKNPFKLGSTLTEKRELGPNEFSHFE